jgi:hypothetical protein
MCHVFCRIADVDLPECRTRGSARYRLPFSLPRFATYQDRTVLLRPWELPSSYPLVAPDYAKTRSSLAKKFGLGRKGPAAPKRAPSYEQVRAKRSQYRMVTRPLTICYDYLLAVHVLHVETTRMSTNWPNRRLADLTSQELQGRAAEYRRMAILASGQDTIRALNTLAVRLAMLAAKREVEKTLGDATCKGQGE